jgi:hypothetical protein
MSARLHEATGDGFVGGNAIALGAADRLSLAAAPTFAGMALLTGVIESGRADVLCSTTHAYSHLGGMVAMYVLMSTFHLAPWLKWISRRSSAGPGRVREGRGTT